MFSWHIDYLIIVKWCSLPLWMFFLKYTHLILILTIQAFFYCWHKIFFLPYFFDLIYVVFRQHIIYSCFISNLTISTFKNVFRLFTFNVNIYAAGFTSDTLLLVSHLSHLILLLLAFPAFFGINFFMIPFNFLWSH